MERKGNIDITFTHMLVVLICSVSHMFPPCDQNMNCSWNCAAV